jgi:hypothetical protein
MPTQATFIDAGYVYAPYIPIMYSAIGPSTMIIGLWGRIGKQLVNPSNPDSVPVIVWTPSQSRYDYDLKSHINRLVYFPETKKCYIVSADGEIGKRYHISKTMVKKLKHYLNAGDVVVQEQNEIAFLDHRYGSTSTKFYQSMTIQKGKK